MERALTLAVDNTMSQIGGHVLCTRCEDVHTTSNVNIGLENFHVTEESRGYGGHFTITSRCRAKSRKNYEIQPS